MHNFALFRNVLKVRITIIALIGDQVVKVVFEAVRIVEERVMRGEDYQHVSLSSLPRS